MSYDKLVTVNYSGGSGGEFISTLLDSTLNDKPFVTTPDSNNKFVFNREYTPIEGNTDLYLPINPQLIFAIHKNPDMQTVLSGISTQDDISIFEKNHRQIYKQYLYVKNPDDEIVKNNIRQMIRQMVPEPTNSYKVLQFHNLKYNVSGLGLGDIFPGSTNITLSKFNDKAHMLFWFLGWYKNQSFRQNIVDTSAFNFLLQKNKLYKSDPLFHNEYIVYVDKLTIQCDEEYIQQVEEDLSNLTGKQVVLDRDLLTQYSNTNVDIIKTQFNLDNNANVLDDNVLDIITNFMESQNV